MACGTPLIASNIACVPEITGGAALLVDPFSTDSIADAIQRVLNSPALRADLRRRGLVRAASFNWEQTAR
ncbi:glycosyltransferase, partial [Roseateles sp. GG27B]